MICPLGAEQMVRGMRGYLINKNPQFLNDFKTGGELARESGNRANLKMQNPEQRMRLGEDAIALQRIL